MPTEGAVRTLAALWPCGLALCPGAAPRCSVSINTRLASLSPCRPLCSSHSPHSLLLTMAEFQIQDSDFGGLEGKVVIVTGKKMLLPSAPAPPTRR